jgi:hypothetical protein
MDLLDGAVHIHGAHWALRAEKVKYGLCKDSMRSTASRSHSKDLYIRFSNSPVEFVSQFPSHTTLGLLANLA